MSMETPLAEETLRLPISAHELLNLARECGADDAGLVSIDNPAMDEERQHIMRAFPSTRTLLALVTRMHREAVRSPARSIANLEFHSAGHEVDEIARRIVRRLEDSGSSIESRDGLSDGD